MVLIASATGLTTAKLLHENGAGYAVGLISFIGLIIYGIF